MILKSFDIKCNITGERLIFMFFGFVVVFFFFTILTRPGSQRVFDVLKSHPDDLPFVEEERRKTLSLPS